MKNEKKKKRTFNLFRFASVVFLSLFFSNARACVIVEPENPSLNNNKPFSSIKHFSQNHDKVRRLMLKNEDETEVCRVRLQAMELIQRLDGSYEFLDQIPGFSMDRSILPFMDLRDNTGQSVLNTEVEIQPKQILEFNFIFKFQQDKQNGSYHGGLNLYFPQYGSFRQTVELYYTFDTKADDKLDLLKLKYNPQKQELDYIVQNIGNAYTFLRFDVTLIDPATGLQKSSYTSSNGKKRIFKGNIKNFPLSKDQTDAKISSSFKINYMLDFFKIEYQKNHPQKALPEVLIAVITPSYGIDHENWTNHFFNFLKRKSIAINQPYR